MHENFKSGMYENREEVFKGEKKSYKSFLPVALKDMELVWNTPEISNLLSETNNHLGRLDAYSELIPDIDIFIRMHILKEATVSSKIEGTRTSVDEAVLPEEEVAPEKRDDWQEVQSYIKAVHEAQELLKGGLPISNRLIKQTHAILLENVRGKDKQPGAFRQIQNWIGAESIDYASFIPPHHSKVEDCLGDLEHFWHYKQDMPTLLKIALFHYQFETIHPFNDGNGRLGRLLITLQLIEQGELMKPTLYLSDFFERNRQDYYSMLNRVRAENDIYNWFKFFLNGVKETSIKGKDTFQQILKLKAEAEQKILKLDKKLQRSQQLLNYLFSDPVVNIKEVEELLGCTYNTAAKLVGDFVELGILNEISSSARNRRYVFKEYLMLF